MAAKDLRSVLFFMADLRKVIRLILSPEPAGTHTDSSLLFVGSSLPEAPREKKTRRRDEYLQRAFRTSLKISEEVESFQAKEA